MVWFMVILGIVLIALGLLMHLLNDSVEPLSIKSIISIILGGIMLIWRESVFLFTIIIAFTILFICFIIYRVIDSKNRVKKTGFFKIEYRGKYSHSMDEANLIVYEMSKSPIIIDIRLWMDAGLECFWEQLLFCCEKNHRPIFIPAEFYDEFSQGSNGGQRRAKNRVMKFDDKKLLLIERLGGRYRFDDTDDIVLAMCKKAMTYKCEFFLLTNNKDLTLLARHLSNNEKELCKVVAIHPTEFSVSQDAQKFHPTVPDPENTDKPNAAKQFLG